MNGDIINSIILVALNTAGVILNKNADDRIGRFLYWMCFFALVVSVILLIVRIARVLEAT